MTCLAEVWFMRLTQVMRRKKGRVRRSELLTRRAWAASEICYCLGIRVIE